MRQAGLRPTAPRASGPSPGDLEAAVESHCEAPHAASWKTSQARPRACTKPGPPPNATEGEWGEAQKPCCPTQCDTTHTELPQCVGSDVGRKALGNGRNASSQIPCASAHSEKCQILLGRIRGRPGALPRDLARDAGPWERAQGAACGDSLSPVPLSAGGALRGPARRSTKAPSASKHRPRAPNFEILCSRAMTPTDWNRNGIARSSELNAFPARCIAWSP